VIGLLIQWLSIVRSNWNKFGLQKSMMNANGFFFFKFKDKKGMMDVIEAGPWMIRNKPIILNVWSSTSKLHKDDIKNVSVWVKLHDVPLVAYTDVGLSLLMSQIGTPKLMDSFTASMCTNVWGRSSFARALVDISADKGFKEEITIVVPELEGDGFGSAKVSVEYEWKPPRCSMCCVFGHDDEGCPSQMRQLRKTIDIEDSNGFQEVKGKKAAKRYGVPVKKQQFEYRPVRTKPKNMLEISKAQKFTLANGRGRGV